MIFTRDFVTRENHWQIASLVTQKSLFTVTHALFFISYQCRKSHCGDKTIVRPSYLHNGISYTGKTTSLDMNQGPGGTVCIIRRNCRERGRSQLSLLTVLWRVMTFYKDLNVHCDNPRIFKSGFPDKCSSEWLIQSTNMTCEVVVLQTKLYFSINVTRFEFVHGLRGQNLESSYHFFQISRQI